MKRLLAAATVAACLSLAQNATADMAEADALYASGRYEEAFDAYAELAKEQDGMAMLRMAQMFEAGEGVAASNTRALTWYRRAAAHDVAEAHFRIGEMYEAGTAVPRDYSAAVRAYQAAADMGHSQALIRLANLYADGSGTMPDASQAARLLKQAADSGDAEAVAALDRLVASGGVPRDVLKELDIPLPPPATLPSVEDLAAQGIATQDDGGSVTAMAAAAAIDESEAAAQVRAALTSAMAGYNREESTLDYSIDVVEDADGAMVATVRGLRLLAEDATWEIGDIVYDLTPAGDTTYDTVVTFPTTTTIYDDKGMAAGGSVIGYQDVRGTWNPALNLWTQGSVDMRDVELRLAAPDEEPFVISVAAITGDTAMEPSEQGKWGGLASFAVEGIAFRSDAGDVGGVERIEIAVDQRAVDYVFFQAMGLARAEFERRFGVTPDMQDSDAQQAMSDLATPLVALARERAPLLGDIGVAFTVLGITGEDPETGAPISLDRLHFALSARDMDTPAGLVSLAIEHSGLDVPVEGVMAAYLPAESAFVIDLRDLPVEDAATMALEMFEEGMSDPASFEDNAMMALTFMGLGLQQSMAQAGSSLNIERIGFVSEALKAEMTGRLVASAASPLGATGTVTLDVEGLDAAVAELSKSADPDAQQAAMPLAMLQAMGERVEDDGVLHHIYVVELTPDGRTLLNGNDMGPMMNGMMGGEQGTFQ